MQVWLCFAATTTKLGNNNDKIVYIYLLMLPSLPCFIQYYHIINSLYLMNVLHSLILKIVIVVFPCSKIFTLNITQNTFRI